jgi:hypothetical protein
LLPALFDPSTSAGASLVWLKDRLTWLHVSTEIMQKKFFSSVCVYIYIYIIDYICHQTMNICRNFIYFVL